ncbi:MAG: PRC-barrel domain-containing protein [Endomicrobium sp.]|jgi:16S rRNA processing protein RimM|nr:PRC-barrel domain-containing protein [Endomicrobium sp.]
MKRLDKSAALANAWRIADILGFEVFSSDGDRLGVLREVINTAGNDIWIVQYDGKEILIPALKSVVRQVDMAAKKIVVSLPDGFEELFGGSKNKAEDVEYDGYLIYED